MVNALKLTRFHALLTIFVSNLIKPTGHVLLERTEKKRRNRSLILSGSGVVSSTFYRWNTPDCQVEKEHEKQP